MQGETEQLLAWTKKRVSELIATWEDRAQKAPCADCRVINAANAKALRKLRRQLERWEV